MTRLWGRRAIIFSLMSVLLSSFFLLLFWSGNTAPLDTTSSGVATRVTVMDQYVSSWDAYTQDATMVSVRSALIGLTTRLQGNTTPLSLSQVEGNISSCLASGSANINGLSSSCFLNINDSLGTALNSYVSLAQQELDINTTYWLDPNITVSDWAPFELRVSFNINYSVQDSFAPLYARWNRSEHYDVIVSVEGLPDPLFARYATAFMNPGGTQRNITQYAVPRDLLTPANLSSLIAAGAYVEDRGLAPTYLQRLAGNLSGPFDPANTSGIETLLQPGATQVAPGLYANTSFTDYQVFTRMIYPCAQDGVASTFGITGLNVPGFYLDNTHLALYNINGGEYNSSCAG